VWPSSVPFAADEEPLETPGLDEVFGGEVDRPIADWFAENVTDHELVVWLIRHGLEPALQILLILVLALALLWFIRRTIRRAVGRAKDPDAARGRRYRQRVGFQGEGRVEHSLRRGQRADALGALATSIAGVLIWTLVVFMVLGTFGITLGPLVAGAGILGLALGFGAQGLVRDFISGVFMLIEDQYGVGDIIDAGEAVGVVEAVTLRTTRIRDIEGTLWHVPNGEIRRVGNKSQEWARVLLDISIAYRTNVDHAFEIIEAVAVAMAEEEAYRDLFMAPPEVWGVEHLGADGVDVRLVIKVQPAKQWALSRELRRRIKAAFDAAGIEIPFPQRTIWLRSEPSEEGGGDGADAAVDVSEGGRLVAEVSSVQRAVEQASAGDRGRERIEGRDLPAAGDAEPGRDEQPPANGRPEGGAVEGELAAGDRGPSS
jgi:moderate conductance mechanosensitive channel